MLTSADFLIKSKAASIDTIYLRCGNSGGGITIINGVVMEGPYGTSRQTPQILELRNSTVRKVIFENDDGEVILIGTSKILEDIEKGSVRNTNNHGRSNNTNNSTSKASKKDQMIPSEIAAKKEYMENKNFVNLCQFFKDQDKKQEADINEAKAAKLLYGVFEIKSGDTAKAELKTAAR